jgi:hypothetical protein
METILSIISTLAVSLASILLPKYLSKRVEEAARGAVDLSVGRELAEHRLTLDKQLEDYRTDINRQLEVVRHSFASERERYSKDYGLFAESRNKVYAETYASFEAVRGAYHQHFAVVTETTDFSRSPAEDLRHTLASLTQISQSERSALLTQIENDVSAARATTNLLFVRSSLREANQKFIEFKNAWVLNALYFSPVLNAKLSEAMKPLVSLHFAADEMIEANIRGRRLASGYKDRSELVKQLASLSEQMRDTMRAEMQAGFQNSANEQQSRLRDSGTDSNRRIGEPAIEITAELRAKD